MLSSNDAVEALRKALSLSPSNIPLRQHLADTLLSLGRLQEAEAEYREALALSPNDSVLKLGLVSVFYQQGKNQEALVLVEDVLSVPDAPARAHLLYARLLLRAGDRPNSVNQYRTALRLDPSVADEDLAQRLGIDSQDILDKEESESPVVDGKIRVSWDDVLSSTQSTIDRPSITFNDVGGMEAVKDEIRIKIIHPLTHPELYKVYGKGVGGGILMYGPPGCGKTHLARATAGEVKASFIAVSIHEVLEMWLGKSEQNLHDLFEQARRNRPCVLFFDEVDALGASRSDMRQSAGRQLINQFLAELDGVQGSNEGVLVLAATNAPWHLDSAFRRPGRFDRIVFVPPPDASARAAILRIQCQGKPVGEIDYDSLAKKTENFSGADLMAAVDTTVEQKLREAIREGMPRPITTKDLASAASTLKPSTREWFATARNHALYANQGGIYDDILRYMKL